MSERVIVAMSGGVDSAVAALLLQQQGHDCAGVHLKLFNGNDDAPQCEKSCCSQADAEDAAAVARRLGLPFYVFGMQEAFRTEVMDRFAAGYLRGETPNPCIDCNRYIKFATLQARALALGYNAVATGHYVRREFNGRWQLRRGQDPGKDQSYVLYAMTQQQLAHTLFPLGEYTKPQVRALAEAQGLRNAHKRDSQDICFVPGGNYAAFLASHCGHALQPGAFIDPQGKVLGQHKGTPCYTIGQRKGLGLALPQPGYVVGISPAQNTVTVGTEAQLYSRYATAKDLNWIAFEALTAPRHCQARVRYHQTAAPCVVAPTAEGKGQITFEAPQRAITPGQAVVFYEEDYVLGGGVLC